MPGTPQGKPISEKVIGRLSRYHRLLQGLEASGVGRIFSHQLARQAGETAALVRRDLMTIGYSGSPNRGYEVPALNHAIGQLLHGHQRKHVALIGVGNLGRALLEYFRGLRANLEISAAFDRDPKKVGRVISGTRIHAIQDLAEVITAQDIRVAMLTVPGEQAQEITDQLLAAGVRSLLNFTRTHLWVPVGIYVEHVDIAIALEKVTYFGWVGTDEAESDQ